MLESFKADPSRPLVVVPDCNILVHGKPFGDMPWGKLSAGEIDIVIVGRVLRDLDHRKRQGGKVGRIARDASSALRPLIAREVASQTVRKSNPAVSRRLWLGQQYLSSPVREGLDLNDPDQTIMNQAFALVDGGAQVLFLTDDGLAAGIAQDFGLPTILANEDWMREPEKDALERENHSLKAKVTRLEAAEPSYAGWFESAAGDTIERLDAVLEVYPPLSKEMAGNFADRIRNAVVEPDFSNLTKYAQNFPSEPPALSGGQSLAPVVTYMDADEVTKYRDDLAQWSDSLLGFFEKMHERLDSAREWPSARFLARNEGTRPASDALVELAATNGLLVGGPDSMRTPEKYRTRLSIQQTALLLLPPQPPRPKRQGSALDRLRGQLLGPARALNPVAVGGVARDPERFYFRTGKGSPVEHMALECQTWRHQRDGEAFPFLIACRSEEASRGLISVSISASNLSEPFRASLPVSVTPHEVSTVLVAEKWTSDVEKIMDKRPFGPWPTVS